LAYDYGCLKGRFFCKGIFRSFNSVKSPDLSSKLVKMIDTNNILNMAFAIIGK